MDYTGMFLPKGVPFSNGGMGKGSLFQADGMRKWGPFQGKVCERIPFKGKVFEKGACQFPKFSM